MASVPAAPIIFVEEHGGGPILKRGSFLRASDGDGEEGRRGIAN